MANPYDKILKEIVEEIFVPMAQRMLGIYPVKTEELPDDLHQTIERKPDFLKLEVLSQIRNLQNQITQILSAMPFTYELEKDIRFQQGITKEKGEMIRRMLQSEEFKTGALTVEMIAAYADESPVHIREVQAQLQSEDETSHS